jgi:hypothetical protein
MLWNMSREALLPWCDAIGVMTESMVEPRHSTVPGKKRTTTQPPKMRLFATTLALTLATSTLAVKNVIWAGPTTGLDNAKNWAKGVCTNLNLPWLDKRWILEPIKGLTTSPPPPPHAGGNLLVDPDPLSKDVKTQPE